jgi:hypothetical protein
MTFRVNMELLDDLFIFTVHIFYISHLIQVFFFTLKNIKILKFTNS